MINVEINSLDAVKYKDLWCRNRTSDKAMVKESFHNYAQFQIDENSIVVDFGGNIGAFGKIALDAGCKELHIFEPESSNYSMIGLNLDSHPNSNRMKKYQTAVSISDASELIFYQNESGNKDCSGTVSPISKRSISSRKIRVSVPNKNINKVLEELQPTHLKIDIEGSEIEWIKQIEADFPESIKELALEIHRDEKEKFFYEFDKVWYPKICEKFEPIFIHPNSGFKNENIIALPNMGIQVHGRLFGIDLLFRKR